MRRDCLDELSDYIQSAEETNRRGVVEDELEEARSRQEKLKGEVDGLRTSLERSRLRIGITPTQFRQTSFHESPARWRTRDSPECAKCRAADRHPSYLPFPFGFRCSRTGLRLDFSPRFIEAQKAAW